MDGSQDGARVGLRQKIAVILMALGLLGAGELAVLTWSDVSQVCRSHTKLHAGRLYMLSTP